MVKSATFEPKKAIGVGLRPSLWERIDRFAEASGKSRNQVIEEILTLYIPAAGNFTTSEQNATMTEHGHGGAVEFE